MLVTVAETGDSSHYATMAVEAQTHLRSIGLTQWVPAAHEPYLPTLQSKVHQGELFKVVQGGTTVAYFCASTAVPEWWNSRPAMALYVSGVVVDRGHKGQSIGTRILKWCHEYAVRGNLHYLRLDCHAESRWLCGYYLQQGFLEVCRVEQHPGYIGVLLEKQLLVVSQ